MPGTLDTVGPLGLASKRQAGRALLDRTPRTASSIDFQTHLCRLAGDCDDGGRWTGSPERDPQQVYALAMAEYLRRAAITGSALNMELEPVIVTNSATAHPERRQFLLSDCWGLVPVGSIVIDPGDRHHPRDTVSQRWRFNRLTQWH